MAAARLTDPPPEVYRALVAHPSIPPEPYEEYESYGPYGSQGKYKLRFPYGRGLTKDGAIVLFNSQEHPLLIWPPGSWMPERCELRAKTLPWWRASTSAPATAPSPPWVGHALACPRHPAQLLAAWRPARVLRSLVNTFTNLRNVKAGHGKIAAVSKLTTYLSVCWCPPPLWDSQGSM